MAIKRQLKFKVVSSKGEQEYIINMPTVGEFYDIETEKQIRGRGLYNAVQSTKTIDAQNAADMIDIESRLSILCEDYIKDQKVKDFKDLDLEDYMMLRKSYNEQFLPWWEEIQKLFMPATEDEKAS